MDSIILTPRLKLTLVTKAEKGSPELEWMHELYSDEKTTLWSIFGKSKSIEETSNRIQHWLPKEPAEGEPKSYHVAYAVHELLENTDGTAPSANPPTQFIGLVTLVSAAGSSLVLPENLTLPPSSPPEETETVILAYQFLPRGWGKGFATESVAAVLEACKKAKAFWAPFEHVYLRVFVNEEVPASLRVMEKLGIEKRGIYEWTGKIWLAGGWREKDNLHIFGTYLLN